MTISIGGMARRAQDGIGSADVSVLTKDAAPEQLRGRSEGCMHSKTLFSVITVVVLGSLTLPCAAEYSPQVMKACRNDYKKYCSEYAPQDPGLRQCMDGAGRSLTKVCVNALIKGGEITRERAMRRWGK